MKSLLSLPICLAAALTFMPSSAEATTCGAGEELHTSSGQCRPIGCGCDPSSADTFISTLGDTASMPQLSGAVGYLDFGAMVGSAKCVCYTVSQIGCTDWMTNTCASGIGGAETLYMTGTTAEEIYFPLLDSVYDVQIKNAPNLHTLSFPKLRLARTLELHSGCPQLTDADGAFPALTTLGTLDIKDSHLEHFALNVTVITKGLSVFRSGGQSHPLKVLDLSSLVNFTGNRFFIQANDQLESIRLDSLTRMNGGDQLNVGYNHKLTFLEFPSLVEFGTADKSIRFAVGGNDLLTAVSMPALRYMFSYPANFEGNANLTSVDFPGLKNFTGRLQFLDNAKLSSISLPLVEGITDTLDLGRLPALTKLSLPKLRTLGALEIGGYPDMWTSSRELQAVPNLIELRLCSLEGPTTVTGVYFDNATAQCHTTSPSLLEATFSRWGPVRCSNSTCLQPATVSPLLSTSESSVVGSHSVLSASESASEGNSNRAASTSSLSDVSDAPTATSFAVTTTSAPTTSVPTTSAPTTSAPTTPQPTPDATSKPRSGATTAAPGLGMLALLMASAGCILAQ